MDIHSLTYFQRVAELQHMTRAAEQLRVAQPALSRTIGVLEEELGVRLFERTGKNIRLNEYGQVLLRHTNQILRELEDIKAEIAEQRGLEDRTVTLSLYAASKLLPQLVMAFNKEYPQIRLHIRQEGLASQERGESDLSIFSSIRSDPGENGVQLIEEEILLALPENNPLACRKSIDLREVAGEEFICLQRGKSLRTITDTYCQMAGFAPAVILESDSPETVRELIRAGIGLSFIPNVTWSGMATEDIALVPISFPRCRRYIHLAWRKGGYFSPAAYLFRDFVQDYFQALAGEKLEG